MMRSGVYVKDYSADRKPKVLPEEVKKDAELIRGYSEFMRMLPKKVSVKKKAQYEQLLDQCDRLAANEGGKIRAMADEEQAEAWIEVTLPFLECTCVPFPVSWTVKMKKKQKETQDILSYHTQAAGCSDKARAKASGGRQPIEECGRTGL